MRLASLSSLVIDRMEGLRRGSGILAALLSLFAVLSGGCIHFRGDMVKLRLSWVAATMGTPNESPRQLVYDVTGEAGSWRHEVVLGEELYGERRTRDDGVGYAFGRDELGAWLTIGEVTVEVGGEWAERVETLSALHRVKFLRPSEQGAVTYLGRDGRYWEMAYRPSGGRTLTFFVDRAEHRPKKLDYVDEWARIVSCHHMRWARGPDGATLAGLRCDASNQSETKPEQSRERIELVSLTGLPQIPRWARPSARTRAAMIDEPVRVAIDDPYRLEVPGELNGVARRFALDSGMVHTVISQETAEVAGVVPTGEPPVVVTPPWLAESEVWIGVAHTLRVGHAVVHGARVLVAKDRHMLGKDDGLLGQSYFRKFVIDVDSPAEQVRIWRRDAFHACWKGGASCADLERIVTKGSAPRIDGEVFEVALGQVLLDTGMAEPMVVLDPMVRWRLKRQPNKSAFLGPRDVIKSADYYAEVPGAQLGPFVFPSFEGIARYRPRERGGPQVAIAGMSLLRYLRIAFDLSEQALYASAGEAHALLLAVGMDIDDGPAGPTVTRVLARSSAAEAGIAEGDLVRSVEGKPIANAREARAALLAERSMLATVQVERSGYRRRFLLDVPR